MAIKDFNQFSRDFTSALDKKREEDGGLMREGPVAVNTPAPLRTDSGRSAGSASGAGFTGAFYSELGKRGIEPGKARDNSLMGLAREKAAEEVRASSGTRRDNHDVLHSIEAKIGKSATAGRQFTQPVTPAMRTRSADYLAEVDAAANNAKTEAARAAAWLNGEKLTGSSPSPSPSLGDRLKNIFTGATKQYAGAMADAPSVIVDARGGTVANELYEEQRADIQKRRDALAAAMAADPKYAKDPEAIWQLQQYDQQLGILEQSVTANRNTGAAARDVAQQLTQSGAADVERAGEGLGTVGKFLVNTGAAGVQMAGDIALGALTGGGNMAPMLMRSFGGGTQEARSKGYNTNQQLALGLTNAATEYFSEKLFGGNPVYDKEGVGLVNKALGAALEKISPDIAGRVMSVLSSTGAEMLNEGWEEVVSDLLNPLWEQIITGNHDPITLEQLVQDWAVGVALGAAGTAGNAGVEAIAAPMQQRAQERRVNAYSAMIDAGLQGQTYEEAAKGAARGVLSQTEMQEAFARGQALGEDRSLRTVGAQYLTLGEDAVRSLISDALERPEGSESRAIAQELTEKMDGGEEFDILRDLGRLHNAVMEEYRAEARETAPAEPARSETATETVQEEQQHQPFGEAARVQETARKTAQQAAVEAQQPAKAQEAPTMAANETAPTAQRSAAGADNLMTGGQTYGEGYGRELSDGGGQRDAGLRAGEQDGSLGAGQRQTAADEVRTAAQRRALVRDLRLQAVDPVNDLHIQNAVDRGDVYVLPTEQLDAPLRKIAENNRRSGVNTVFTLGGVSIRKRGGAVSRARGVYVPATNTVYVQADNVSATPEQISEHELWHARSQYSPEQDRMLEERIRERYSREEFEKVLDRYIRALNGVIDLHEGMTDDEYEAALRLIKNELFADAVSGLNGFGAGATQFSETAQQFRDEYWGSSEQTSEATENATGPPAQFSFAERHVPTYEELIEKSPIEVVDLRGGASSNVGQMAHDFKKSAEAAEIIKEPVLNEDTQEQVFITPKTFDHSFSGISTNKIEAARKIREIIRTSVLTHSEPSRAERDHSTGVYTLFGVVRTEDGIRPVKLKVKEFRNEGQQLPANIREALGDDYETYARAYDNRVLVLDGIEKETSGSAGLATDEAVGRSGPEVSTVNVADLYRLVNSEYRKYLPQPTGAEQFSIDTDTDEMRRELRERGDVETRRALADTDRAAFRENEERRRQLRRDIREQENRPKEIASVEQELERRRDKQYQHDLLDKGGVKALAENEKYIKQLEQRLERLRGEERAAKPKREKKPTKKSRNAPTISVRQLQNDLLRYFSVPEGQKKELGRFISTFADKVYREGKLTQQDYDEIMDRLYGAGVVSVPASEYQKAGRDAVKDGRIYVPADVKAEFGDDWNAFRIRAMAAGVYLVNDNSARGADQWNVELSDLFPGIFDAQDTDLRGIIEQIVRLAEEGKDQKMSLSDYTAMLAGQEYMTEDDMQEEMERHIDWALRTFAEKAGLEVYLKDRADKMVQQERAAAWERRQAEQQRKKADRELRDLQKQTLKALQWLQANRNKAPAELRKAYDDVLSDIDIYAISAANELNWNKRYQMSWRDLVDMYEAKTTEGSDDYDPNFIPSEELKKIYQRLRVKKQHIADMDIGALQDLYKAAVGLRQEAHDRANLLNDEFNRTIAGVYADSKAELEKTPHQKSGAVRTYGDMQLTPMNRFAQMVGWDKGSAWYSMAKMLEKGERDQRRFKVEANAMLAEFLTQHADWAKRADGQGKNGIWYEVQFSPVSEWGEMDQPIFGPPVTVYMTPAMKVQMYLESKSEDNLRHMEGGRTFADRELYSQGKRQEAYAAGRTFKMAPEAVKRIVSDLTAEEKALADVLEKFYNQYSKQEINRVSNILYGYDKAMGKYYAPIYTDSNYTKSEPGIFDITAEGVGNLKTRKVSWTPSMNLSAFDAFEKSVDRTGKFVGLAIPIRNMSTLWNWWSDGESMKDVLEHTQGLEASKFVDELMKELQGVKEVQHPKLEQLTDKALSKYITAVFGFNPSVVLKQFASYPLAAAYLGYRNMPVWVPGAAQVDTELIRLYSGELAYRTMGYATPETALIKDNPGIMQTKGPVNFLFGGGSITWMDGFTVRCLWTWAENKVRNETQLRPGEKSKVDAGEDPFYQAVAREFEEAVSRSQPMYDTMHRSQVMRESGSLARMFTLFKTVPQQELNMLAEAFGEMQYAKQSGDAAVKKAASAKVGKTVTGVLAGNLMIGAITFLAALLKNGAKGYRDDKEKLTPESFMEQFGKQYLRDSIGLVIGGDMIADIIGAAFGARWYGMDAPGAEQIDEIAQGLANAGKNIKRLVGDSIEIASNGGDWMKYMREHSFIYVRGVEDAVKLLGTYAGGLPVNNVRAYLLGALQWISPEVKTAYEDAVKHADRSGLKGLTGDALEMRTEHILGARLDDPSEELTKALAGLYAAGYTNAIPTDTPDSVTIDGEAYSLGIVQQQAYSNTWRDAVGDQLEELIASDAWKKADEKTRTAMVKKIYDYAAAEAKGAVFSQFSAEEANKTAAAAMAAGASLCQYAEISAVFSSIDADKDKTSTQRGAMKRAAILEMELTDQEKLDLYAALGTATKRPEKLQAIKDSGMTTARVFAVYDKYEEISDSGMAASEKAATFSRWIDEQRFTEKQAAAIREQLTFSATSTASSKGYDKFRDAGLSTDKSFSLFETMRELEPAEGKETVSDSQRLHAIADSKLSDADKIKAMGVVMGTEMVSESGGETAYSKMLTLVNGGTTINDYLKLYDAGQVDGYIKLQRATGGFSYGITPSIYVEYRAALPGYDANGNKNYSQAEVKAALDDMTLGDNPLLGGSLTRQQKAVLWQLANSSWKPYKNPYDTQIGQAVYDGVHLLSRAGTLSLSGGADNPLMSLAVETARESLK